MLNILSDIKQIVNDNKKEIILVTIVILLSLLSFAVGFITAKLQEKEPLRIDNQ